MAMWMIWLIAAVVFLILEAVSPAFLFICFTGGAVGAALTSGFSDSMTIQVVVFAVVSVALIPLSRPIAKRLQRRGANKKSNVDAYVGQIGYVTESIDPAANSGRLRMGSENWRASSHVAIAAGARVTVVGVNGVTLIVEPAVDDSVTGG
jgi:membrane protein implicated in regulation of membrane protease activity